MARTLSNMLPLGTIAPDFNLFDTTTQAYKTLSDVTQNRPFVVMFICNHCPFVVHLHQGIQEIVNRFANQVDFIAVSANDVLNYPDDSPELMKALFEQLGLQIPYFYDETQAVAKAYEAACTPDFYLFNEGKKLVYRGQFDDSRPGNDKAVTGKDLSQAILAVLNNEKVEANQLPSLGCNIKWK